MGTHSRKRLRLVGDPAKLGSLVALRRGTRRVSAPFAPHRLLGLLNRASRSPSPSLAVRPRLRVASPRAHAQRLTRERVPAYAASGVARALAEMHGYARGRTASDGDGVAHESAECARCAHSIRDGGPRLTLARCDSPLASVRARRHTRARDGCCTRAGASRSPSVGISGSNATASRPPCRTVAVARRLPSGTAVQVGGTAASPEAA